MADGSLSFDTKIDESGFNKGLSKVKGVFGKAGGLLSKAGAAVGGLATAGATAFTAITKSALDGVAQLEQNIGGVETLFTNEFGSAADTVIENANRAYETAGMSANDYMSTVTSFSASLLQAVGNDTAEAAKVADMAIVDMSDNANKMGTSMDAIQSAYQGFAKQNYTMLDNLKLGYGGTKTEMERLLSDAEKLSGVEYDINNLSDVYNAIHVIQSELGITGTTAKEAASTIEGSMSSAKAAWDNFLAGTGSVDEMAEAFGTAAGVIVDNLGQIIPRLTETLPALIDAVGQQLPALVETLLPALVAGGTSLLSSFAKILPSLLGSLGSVAPALFDAVQDLASQLLDALTSFDFAAAAQSIVNGITNFINGDGLGKLWDTGTQIISTLVMGIAQALPDLIPAMVQLLTYMAQTLIQNVSTLLPAAVQLILSLAEGLIKALPQLVAAIPQIIAAIVEGLIKATPQIFTAAKNLLWQIIIAVPEIVKSLNSIVPNIIKGIVNGLAGGLGDVKNAALDLGGSILDGISDVPEKIAQALAGALERVAEWGGQILSSVQSAVQNMLNVAEQIISQLPGKIWTWLVNTVTRVATWHQQMVNAAKTTIDEMISGIVSLLTQLPSKVQTELAKVTSGMVSWGSDIVDKMKEVGSNIVTGIWDGISSGWSWLKDKLGNLAHDLLDAAKDALGINSPSTEFSDEFGRHLMPGAIVGVKKSLPAALKDMKESATELITAMKSTVDAQMKGYKVNVSGAADRMALAGGGSVTYVDHGFTQENTYNVPVATPSEVNKAQREAFRKMAGGVK